MYLNVNNRKQVQALLLNSSTETILNSIQMDYEALANLLPKPPKTWTQHQVHTWLHFVHLPHLSPIFAAHHINGPHLLTLNQAQLQSIGINKNITLKKLMRWIKEGLTEFEIHLKNHDTENKQNIPPLQKKVTIERQTLCAKQRPLSFVPQDKGSMIVRSCDGNLAAFYVMCEKSLKIGRLNTNTIRSLQVSIANEHAEIFKLNSQYYLRDKGSKSGTFIKIVHPIKLNQSTLVQMGSFLIEVRKVDKQSRTIALQIIHMVSEGTCELIISLQEGCSFYSFGRRKTNNFSFDDQHLSGMHARIFLLQGEFFIEDLHSTNGTWLRLSKPSEVSNNFLLEDECIFKVGTTITYQCEVSKKKIEQKMDIQYDDSCIECGKQKKNILLLPCRHNVVCSMCVQGISSCMMCGANIQEKVKIFI